MSGEQELEANTWDELFVNSTLLTWLSMGAAALSFALLWFFAAETARYRRIAAENQNLFNKAEAANQEKSQFLTMMSHELRTPMNGILGTIALAKSQGGTERQMDLLSHAGASSAQMNELLGDILDFAALENGKAEVSLEPFTLEALLNQLMTSLRAVSETGGLVFSVKVESDESELILGDVKRVRQALVHLAIYLADATSSGPIEISLSHTNGFLTADVQFPFKAKEENWDPGIVLGENQQNRKGFSSDALGPSIARSHVFAMGGKFALKGDMAPDGHSVIRISLPFSKTTKTEIKVGLDVRSATLETLVKSVLKSPSFEFSGANFQNKNTGCGD